MSQAHVGDDYDSTPDRPEYLRGWVWDGASADELLQRAYDIEDHCPWMWDDYASSIPEDLRAERRRITYSNPVNSIEDVHESIKVLAVDKRGIALLMTASCNSYTGAEGWSFSTRAVSEVEEDYRQHTRCLILDDVWKRIEAMQYRLQLHVHQQLKPANPTVAAGGYLFFLVGDEEEIACAPVSAQDDVRLLSSDIIAELWQEASVDELVTLIDALNSATGRVLLPMTSSLATSIESFVNDNHWVTRL